ncbi:MAG: hypothetical protein ACRCW2_14315 [Cellulosilyticaceae bacterium]
MNQNWDLELFNETFEGQMRRVDELIGQLEVWCDTYTINHKKEEMRLDDYAVLSTNLYEQVQELKEEIGTFEAHEQDEVWVAEQTAKLEEKMRYYEPTECMIKEWMMAIKGIQVLLINSAVLQKHREHIQWLLDK